MNTFRDLNMFETIIGAGIGALGSIAAALLGMRGKKKAPGAAARTWGTVIALGLAGMLLGAVLGFWVGEVRKDVLKAPFDLQGYYHLSGFMGDYANVKMSPYREHPSPNDSDSACLRFQYGPSTEPDAKGWAGVYWQRPAGNWGKFPGAEIQGASKLTFFARGEREGQLVEFKVGGIRSYGNEKLKYSDSLEKNLGQVSLTADWKRYEISLKDSDLSCVIGAFAWIASANANPGELVFYIDQIRFE